MATARQATELRRWADLTIIHGAFQARLPQLLPADSGLKDVAELCKRDFVARPPRDWNRARPAPAHRRRMEPRLRSAGPAVRCVPAHGCRVIAVTKGSQASRSPPQDDAAASNNTRQWTLTQPKTCCTLARVPWVTERASPAPTESRFTTRDAGDPSSPRGEVPPKPKLTLRPPTRPSRDCCLSPHLGAAVSPTGLNQGSRQVSGRPFRHPLQPERTRWPVWRASRDRPS
jgi:hypothetical protein